MNPDLNSPLVQTMESIFLCIFILSIGLVLYLYKSNSKYLLTALPLVAIATHQFEEYILSPWLLGETYHFLNWSYRSGVDISAIEVATVNTFPYFFFALLFLVNPSTKIFAILFLFIDAVALSNGMWHLGLSTAQSDFSPGMITSLFIFVPLYIKALYLASEKGISMRVQFGLTVAGFINHFIMIWLVNIF